MRELPSIGALQTLQTRQRRPYIYKATENAAWTSTGWTTYSSTWRVKVKKVKMDGTLDTIELTKDCIGAETDPMPIASGDYCIETVTADGLRALKKVQPPETVLPFRVRVGVGDAAAYMEAYYPQAGIVRMNGRTVLGFGTSINEGYLRTTQAHSNASGWVVVRLLPSGSDPVDPWNPDSGTDYIYGELAYLSSLPDPSNSSADFWKQNYPIARCVYASGAWTITQLHEGAITFNGWGSDTMLSLLDNEGANEYRSISPKTSFHGALQIEGFDDPQDVGVGELTPGETAQDCRFMMRYADGTNPVKVKYFQGGFLTDLIEALYDFDAKFAAAFAEALHNDLDGLQGGAAEVPGTPPTPSEYYHLTEAEHTAAVALAGFAEETVWVITEFTGTPPDPLVPIYAQRIILTKAVP